MVVVDSLAVMTGTQEHDNEGMAGIILVLDILTVVWVAGKWSSRSLTGLSMGGTASQARLDQDWLLSKADFLATVAGARGLGSLPTCHWHPSWAVCSPHSQRLVIWEGKMLWVGAKALDSSSEAGHNNTADNTRVKATMADRASNNG